MDNKLDLSDKLMGQFEIFPNFHRPVNNPENRILWIKFSPDGEQLIAGSNKRNIGLYDCNTGLRSNSITLDKHGMSCIDYTDSNDVVLVGSNGMKNDFAVRELNLTKICYGTRYTGHQLPAVGIDVNREKKYFITSGYDKCAMLFDFRIQTALCRSNLPCPPLVALHPTTNICAMAFDNYRVEIYDLRSMDLGPFSIFKLNTEHVKWTSLKYSPDGQQLLISSNGSTIRIINSFTGVIQEVFGCRKNSLNIPIDASFTPNSDYILTGSSDGNVYVFGNHKKDQRMIPLPDRARKVAELPSMQPEAITAVEMSSKYSLMETASSYVAFWAPNFNN